MWLFIILCNSQDDIDTEVVLCPDYVRYRDIYCTGAQLTFSHSCIKISGSPPRGNEGTFNFECGVDDLVDIVCQWMRRVSSNSPVRMFGDTHICLVLKFCIFLSGLHPGWDCHYKAPCNYKGCSSSK